jgi:hypothetical protein
MEYNIVICFHNSPPFQPPNVSGGYYRMLKNLNTERTRLKSIAEHGVSLMFSPFGTVRWAVPRLFFLSTSFA